MTKEQALKYYEGEANKYAELEAMEFELIIKNLRSIANEMEEDKYLNEYKIEKLMSRIAEYKNWREHSSRNIGIYNAIRMLDE